MIITTFVCACTCVCVWVGRLVSYFNVLSIWPILKN